MKIFYFIFIGSSIIFAAEPPVTNNNASSKADTKEIEHLSQLDSVSEQWRGQAKLVASLTEEQKAISIASEKYRSECSCHARRRKEQHK